MFDRLLDENTIVTPEGFQEVFGDGKPNEKGELSYGMLQHWTSIDGRERKTWKAPPSMNMVPLDKEAEAAYEKRFATRSARPPEESLPMKVA